LSSALQYDVVMNRKQFLNVIKITNSVICKLLDVNICVRWG